MQKCVVVEKIGRVEKIQRESHGLSTSMCVVRLPGRKQWRWAETSVFAGLARPEQVRLKAAGFTAVL